MLHCKYYYRLTANNMFGFIINVNPAPDRIGSAHPRQKGKEQKTAAPGYADPAAARNPQESIAGPINLCEQ